MQKRSESGVSENVGIILVVAITVIMAAIIAAYAFGLTQNVKKTYTVLVTVTYDPDGSAFLTYYGGPDSRDLSSLTTVYDNGDKEPWTGPLDLGYRVPVRSGEHHVLVVGVFAGTDNHVVLNSMV